MNLHPHSRSGMPQSATTSAEIQAIFDRIAPVYDDFNQWLSLGQHRIWKLMAVKWAEPKPGDRGLDICCGSGDLTRQLAWQIGPTGSVTGLDFSTALLDMARQHSQALGSRCACHWVVGDALRLPFPEDMFDCATMGYGLRNVVSIPQCLQEIYRVLKPGAKVAILDFHRPSTGPMQQFQDWYLARIVVPLAERFGLTEEYAYISPSLERFPNGLAQVQLALSAGFTDAIHYPISGGMMGVLVLTK